MNNPGKKAVRLAALVAILVLLYLVKNALFPIIIGLILFYMLDPLATLLSNPRPKGLGLHRTVSVLITVSVFAAAAVTVAGVMLPPLIVEFNRLSDHPIHEASELHGWQARFAVKNLD